MTEPSSKHASRQVELVHWSEEDGPARRPDRVASEEPLELRVQGTAIAVLMRTPGADQELAAGFLLSEGIIRDPRDIVELAHCQRAGGGEIETNVLNIFLRPGLVVDLEGLSRRMYAASSCGICGKASIDAVHQHFPPVCQPMRFSIEQLLTLPTRLREQQGAFSETGGLHAAAIFTDAGELVVLREDVGRHNAVDKAIGFGALQAKLPFDAHVLLLSGRASFEILQKALAARLPIIAAISAPSSLAVEFARESGQTLVGFLRGRGMNIYTAPERLTGSGA